MSVALVHSAVRQALGDIREAASRLNTGRSNADRRMTSFLGSGWTGEASESFVEAWADWRAAATDVEEGLVAMAELLAATHADLVAQDEDSQRNLDTISARIIDRLG